MILKLYPENPNERVVRRIVGLLRDGGVIVYPTDTVYAFGCALGRPRAVERLRSLRGGKAGGALSLVCRDLSQAAAFARVDNFAFRLLKRNLPGPFTFLLPASSKLSDKVTAGHRTVGIRVPDNSIALAVVAALGEPMATASVRTGGEGGGEYFVDPEAIHERYASVDAVVDGGPGGVVPSAVVDCTVDGRAEVIRPGRLELEI